mgnify:CR=1 FL=1
MSMNPFPLAVAAATALSCAALALPAAAQQQQPAAAPLLFPVKPVRLLVGSPPGGPSDISSRLLAERLGDKFKHTVTVENKPGAANGLASKEVANAPPDGHTLVNNPDTVVTVNAYVYKNMGYDPRTDLVPVTIIATFSQMLVCNAGLGIKTVDELLARAKKENLQYASGGAGSPGHLAFTLLLDATKTKMDHVPYKGPVPGTQAVLAGEVACGFLATPGVLPHVKAGKLTALAVSSAEPSPLAPEVPPLTKVLGRSDVDATFKLVLMAPKGTPAPVVAAVQAAVHEVLLQPDVRARFAKIDLVAVGSTSAEAQRVLQADGERWSGVIKRIDLKLE